MFSGLEGGTVAYDELNGVPLRENLGFGDSIPLFLDYQGASGQPLIADKFPGLGGSFACYIADHPLNFCGKTIFPSVNGPVFPFMTTLYMRAAIMKPVGGSAEMHVLFFVPAFPTGCTLLAHYKYTFASVPIDCGAWDWTGMEVIEAPPYWQLQFSLGSEDCYYYPPSEPPCCEGSDRPATLTAMWTLNGVPQPDITLYYNTGSLPGNFTYTDDPDQVDYESSLTCIQELGDTDPAFGFPGGFGCSLTRLSCSPFHFVASCSDGTNTYEVEIIE
jgi:hypothetical protein